MLKASAVFLLAALAGYLAGQSRSGPLPGPTGQDGSTPFRREPRVALQAEDLLGWIHRPYGQPDRWNDPDLDEWTDAELQAALDEAVGAKGAARSRNFWNQQVPALVGEWMRRDTGAVVAWFDSLVSESMKSRIAPMMGQFWPAERGDELFPFALRNQRFLRSRNWTAESLFLSKACTFAAKRGPSAVVEVLETAGEQGFDTSGLTVSAFPEGFDFAALAGHPGMADRLASGDVFFAGAWMRADPDRAFEILVERSPRLSDELVSSLLKDAIHLRSAGEPEPLSGRTRWLAERTGKMEPETARNFAALMVAALASESPEDLGSYVTWIEIPDRSPIIGLAARRLLAGRNGIETTLDFLEAHAPVEERLATLAAITRNPLEGHGGWLEPGGEEKLRSRLAKWGVAEERAGPVIRNITGSRQ